jgi:hypothetical protein
MQDNIKYTGELTVMIHDGITGELKSTEVHKNLVVKVGRDFAARRLHSNADSPMSHMAIGTNNVTQTPSNQILGAEIARVAFASVPTTTDSTTTFVGTFNAGVGTGTITEAGIFNDAGSNTGVMLARTTFNAKPKLSTDIFTIIWNITAN